MTNPSRPPTSPAPSPRRACFARCLAAAGLWLILTAQTEVPPGWLQAGFGGDGYTMTVAEGAGRDGSDGLAIRCRESSPVRFLGAMQQIDADPYLGRRIRLTAWIRVHEVERRGALFLRIRDRDGQPLAFDNMADRPVRGTSGWRRHEVVLDVPAHAAEVAFGVFLDGPGALYVDDFRLEPVGEEVAVTQPLRTMPLVVSPEATARRERGETGSGWLLGGSAPDDYEVATEPTGGRTGTRAASLRARVPEPEGFVTLMRWIDAAPYRGERLRLSAWVAPREVERKASLWMRVDHPDGRRALAFDNMTDRPIRGTSGWRRHEIVLDVSNVADRIFYGAILDGPGSLRVDDFRIERVGPEVPVTDTLRPTRAPRNLDFEGR